MGRRGLVGLYTPHGAKGRQFVARCLHFFFEAWSEAKNEAWRTKVKREAWSQAKHEDKEVKTKAFVSGMATRKEKKVHLEKGD